MQTLSTIKTTATIAGVMGALGVALGAFGAHGLQKWAEKLDDGAKRLAWWDTATEYLLWHALLAAVFAVLSSTFPRALTGALLCAAGALLFSGSLYAMTLTGITKLGMVTPFGGLAYIAAWIWLVVTVRSGVNP